MLETTEGDNFQVDHLRMHFEVELEMEVVDNLVAGWDYRIVLAVVVDRLMESFVEKD